MVVTLPLPVLERLAEPALEVVTQYLERRSYLGVFVLLFLGAFGPSPPEEIVLLIAGFMVFQGIARFPLMVGVSLAGIVVSDSILYGFGVLFGETLERHRFLKKIFPPKKVEKIKTSFRKYRYRFLFLARYLYGLRPVVFFTAGTARMPFGRFVVTDLVASLVNCVLWTSLGLLFGSRIEDAIRFARRSELILLSLVVALILYFVVETLLVKRKVVLPPFLLDPAGDGNQDRRGRGDRPVGSYWSDDSCFLTVSGTPCIGGARSEDDDAASPDSSASPGGASGRRGRRGAHSEQPVVAYRPQHQELRYTFGGSLPARRIRPGTRIVSWTEDCYDGAVTKPGDLPTKVQAPGHDNPQTGPFFIEGAEPGDTLAVHIEKLEPARDWAISSSFPGFGALNGTDRTAILGPELPETVWFYRVDRDRRVGPIAIAGRTARLGSAARAVSGLPGRCARRRRGALDDRAGQFRRKHGLPGGQGRQHGVSGRAHAGSASLVRRRPLRDG